MKTATSAQRLDSRRMPDPPATVMTNHVRNPPPRQLTQSETLDSLDHWKAKFRQYYRKDDDYKEFLSDVTWDPSKENYGFTPQDLTNAAEVRKTKQKAENLQDFLELLAGYLPYSYLTPKIVQDSTSLSQVWRIVYEHYNVLPNPETFLDFESLKKEPAENYRQFFERLLQHSRLHLADAGSKVENIKPAEDEKMSITLMNHIALHWLRKIDPQLISIIRTEYSTELRSGTHLAALVPRIAPNITSLLSRHSSAKVNAIKHDEEEEEQFEDAEVRFNKMFPRNNNNFRQDTNRGRGTRRFDSQRGRGGAVNTSSDSRGPFCPSCYYIAKQTGAKINYRHLPKDCRRKDAVARLLEAEDQDSEAEGDPAEAGKCENPAPLNAHTFSDQNSEKALSSPVSTFYQSCIFNTNMSPIESKSDGFKPVIESKAESHISDFDTANLQKVNQVLLRKETWKSNLVSKEKSPTVGALVNRVPCTLTIDEGSEINCLDKMFALKSKIEYVPTSFSAKAAGSSPMPLAGESKFDVSMQVQGHSSPITWKLGKCLIVENLGVEVLVGEPGKGDNKIVTLPHLKTIQVEDDLGNQVELDYSAQKKPVRHLCRSLKTQVVYPGETVEYQVPENLQNGEPVIVTPVRGQQTWIPAAVMCVNDGQIILQNETDQIYILKKN